MNDWDVVARLLQALSGFAWPVVVLIAILVFRNEIRVLLGRLRRGKLLGQEIELEQRVEEFRLIVDAASVESAASPAGPQAILATANATDNDVADVLEVAARRPTLALIQLATLLERELRLLSASLGVADPAQSIGAPRYLDALTARGYLPPNTQQSLSIFWNLRNTIVHSRAEIPENEILSVLDIGISLLGVIRAVPHEIARVSHADVQLFADAEGRQPVEDAVGVILDVRSPGGARLERRVYPTGERGRYRAGMRVSWHWKMTKTWARTWYRDPTSGEITLGWDSSAEFVGRPVED